MRRIIIEISDEYYGNIHNIQNGSIASKMILNAVMDGYPLPEGHGRLIDADYLSEDVSSWGSNDYDTIDFIEAIDDAPTVVAADKLVDLYEEFKDEFEEE